MLKHPLLALCTTTLTLATTGTLATATSLNLGTTTKAERISRYSAQELPAPRELARLVQPEGDSVDLARRTPDAPFNARALALYVHAMTVRVPQSQTIPTTQPVNVVAHVTYRVPPTTGRHGEQAMYSRSIAGARTASTQSGSAGSLASIAIARFVRSEHIQSSRPMLEWILHSTTAALHPAVRTHAVRPYIETAGAWLELRNCESGDNYREDTGNGYFGAYQFLPSTWAAIGYSGLPSDASPQIQDAAARALEARSGWRAWPVCSVTLGLR